jgi:multiple sugar transport system substrate-binding protein
VLFEKYQGGKMKNNVSRRAFLKLSGSLAAGTLLAACAAAPGAAPAGPAPAGERQVVTFTMYGHPGMIEEMVPLFNESHPDIEVQFERSEGQGYWEKLTAAIAAGSAWDAFRSSPANTLQWGIKDVLVELSPFIEVDSEYPTDLYLPGVLDAFAYEDKRYGLPAWCLTMWLFYNKRLLDEAGVAYPTPETTWEQYVEMAQQLTTTTDAGDIQQYGANGWGSWTLPVAQDVWSAGGCFYYNEDLTAICMDDPTTIRVMDEEENLMNQLQVHPSPLSPPTTPVSLLSGKVATELNGDWMPWDNREQWLDEFDATLTPLRAGQRVNCYFPDPLVIHNQSTVKDAAYRWISWFAADPASWAIQGKVVFPVTKRQYEDPALRETWLVHPRPPGMIELALQHSQDSKFWRIEPHSSEFESTIYYPEIDKLWRNVASAEEVCTIITEKGNELLAKSLS